MGKKVRKQYTAPLPITISTTVYGALPEIYPHNPVSWICFLYKYVKILMQPVPQSRISNIQVSCEDGIYKVKAPQDINRLWEYGFFGKGSLSRSDPSWATRTVKRLHLTSENEETTRLSNEEITKLRRLERTKFKKERARESELNVKRRQGALSADEESELAEIKKMLIEFRKSNKLKLKEEQATPIPFSEMRIEDQALVDEQAMTLHTNLEYLQLQGVETLFLKFALNVIDVIDASTHERLTEEHLLHRACAAPTLAANDPFMLQYVVYHHFRALGWCVRSGVKFGCDYILYKRGPPFSHAEHAIVIQATDGSMQKSLNHLHTISRVIGSVKKNLILTYVEPPCGDSQLEFERLCRQMSRNNLYKALQLYRVNEIVYRRWIPNRTRD